MLAKRPSATTSGLRLDPLRRPPHTRDNLVHSLGRRDHAKRRRHHHHCAMPLLKRFELAGAIRVSLALYNDSEDLERFFEALDQALELLR